jgi:hypothetical protein
VEGGAWVLKGDLATTPLADVLTTLAAEGATGCLHVVDDEGEESAVYLKNGLVYSAYVPGRRPQLGARLVSSGALGPEALEEALDAQENELQGWRLGELLVHLGYVDRGVVEAFVIEQLRESLYDLSRWTGGRWRFRKNEKTREDVGGTATVAELLAEVARREREWAVITESVHGPQAVPLLGAGGLAAAEMTLDADQWALLCKVDGMRTVADLARECGFTAFEAGQIVHQLVTAGLLEVEETVLPGGAGTIGDDDGDGDDAEEAPTSAALASALAAFLTEPTPQPQPQPLPEPEPTAAGAQPAPVDASLLAAYLDEDLLAGLTVEPIQPVSRDADDLPLGAFEEELTSFEDDDLPAAARISNALVVPMVDEAATATAEEEFADSLSRVSAALDSLLRTGLTPTTEHADVPVDADDSTLSERIRLAAAADLQAVQAEEEAARLAALAAPEALAELQVPTPTEPPDLTAATDTDDLDLPDATGDPHGAPDGDPYGDPDGAADDAVTALADLAALLGERTETGPEPEPVVEWTPALDAEPEPVVEWAPALDVEAEAAPVMEWAANVDPEPAPTFEPEVEAEVEAEPGYEPVAVALPTEPQAETEPAELTEVVVDGPEPGADLGFFAAPPPPAPREGADKASLLRELTSLGLDDEPEGPRPAPAPSAPRPVAAPNGKDAKKRKGLFSRG